MNHTTNNTIRSIILAAVIALIIAAFPASVFAAGRSYGGSSHKAGDKVGAYSVVSVSDFNVFDAKVTVLEHDKTGARVVIINNDDPNRYFMLEFETPVKDDRGTAHVFEHSTMNGSEKYPSRSLTMALHNEAYVTYANAMTQDKCTIYPVGSLSEKELLKLADYYTDSCFHPMILKDRDIFSSEAWRYSLPDLSEDITINGTIYSEMSAEHTADIEAVHAAIGLLYPGSSSAYDSGGVPSEILKLTYEDVCRFHDEYYHPSNCTAYLYGDIQAPDEFLKLLDGYFTEYDRKEIDTGTKVSISPSSGFYIEKKYDHPAATGTSVNNRTEIVYAVDIGHPSDEELSQLYAFTGYCGLDSSYVMMRLRSIYPLSDFEFGINSDDKGGVFYVRAHGMNAGDSKVFKESIDKIFADMGSNGIAPMQVENYRKIKETDASLAREGSSTVVSVLSNISNMNSCGRGELFYINMRDSYRDMSWFDNDYVKKTTAQYLVKPKRSAMTVVSPKPGLAEENAAKLEERLASMKEAMSETDRKKLVEDTKRIVSKSSDDPSEYLDELNVVSIAGLPKPMEKAAVSDTTDRAGTRYINTTIENGDIEATRLFIDATGLPQEGLHYLALFVDLVNGCYIPAGVIPREEVSALAGEVTLRGQTISLTTSGLGDDYKPYVVIDFLTSPEDAADAFGLCFQRLYNSDFSDSRQVFEGISAIKNSVKRNVENNPARAAQYIAYGSLAEGAAYYSHTHYIEYYDFLESLEKRRGEDHGQIEAGLNSIAAFLNNSYGAVLASAVSAKNTSSYKGASSSFFDNLDNTKRKKAAYSFRKYAFPLAIITDAQTVSNVIATGDANLPGTGKKDITDELALKIIVGDYVKPEVRNTYGTYSALYNAQRPTAGIYTVSDPVVGQTFSVFSNIPGAWEKLRTSLDEKTLAPHILRLHCATALSEGEISDAMENADNLVSGLSATQRVEDAGKLCTVKLSDLEKYDEFFEDLAENGKTVTAGSAEIINRNRDLYAQILDPFAQ